MRWIYLLLLLCISCTSETTVNNESKGLSSHPYASYFYTYDTTALIYRYRDVAHGLAEELQKYNVASNCLWPRTSLDTAAVRNVIGSELIKGSRKPSIYADAAYAVLKRDSSTCTGNFFLDQDVLEEEGVTDFDQYAIDPDATLVSDFFVDDNPEDWIQAL